MRGPKYGAHEEIAIDHLDVTRHVEDRAVDAHVGGVRGEGHVDGGEQHAGGLVLALFSLDHLNARDGERVLDGLVCGGGRRWYGGKTSVVF